MSTDLTAPEIKGVKDLLSMGFSRDFVAHTIVMGREVVIYTDVRAAVDDIAEEEEEEKNDFKQ